MLSTDVLDIIFSHYEWEFVQDEKKLKYVCKNYEGVYLYRNVDQAHWLVFVGEYGEHSNEKHLCDEEGVVMRNSVNELVKLADSFIRLNKERLKRK